MLGKAIRSLAAQDLLGRSAAALGEDVKDLRRGIDLLEAECSRRLGRFDEIRDDASRQAMPLISWLQGACGLSGGAAAERVEVARELPALPLTSQALALGTIGYEQARVLARAARDLGAEAVRAAETELLEAARTTNAGELRLVARDLRNRVDPQGAVGAANRLYERRHLHLGQLLDGSFSLDGLLDSEGGARLNVALASLCTPGPGDTRSAGQRRADALVELATRQLQGGQLPLTAGQRPHLTLLVSAAALAGEAAEQSAEMGWAGPVTTPTAQRLACDAAVTRVTVSPSGQPLDVGRAARTIPPAMRTALVARDRQCCFPGCDRPPSWTDGHHITPWAEGGSTCLENLVLLCRRHHRSVHEGGWRLFKRDGELVVEPP